MKQRRLDQGRARRTRPSGNSRESRRREPGRRCRCAGRFPWCGRCSAPSWEGTAAPPSARSIVQRTPRRPRSMASVKPGRPGADDENLGIHDARSRSNSSRTQSGDDRLSPLCTGSKSASSVPSCTTSPTAHFSAFRRPSAGARNVCSIFIASSTSSGAPRRKSTPGSASIRVTVPGIGATMRLAAAASPMSAANGSIQASSMWPRGVVRCERRGRTRRPRPAPARRPGTGRAGRRRAGRIAAGHSLPPNSMVNPSRPYQRSASYRCAP